jgi:uncharacterized protein (TIGR02596 family)
MVKRMMIRHPLVVTKERAMSLLELLVVMAIAVMLMSVAAGGLLLSRSAPSMSAVILQIQGVLDEGRQLALANNKYVQVRFYSEQNGGNPKGYEAVGLFLAESPFYGDDYETWMDSGQFKPASKIHHLGGNMMLVADGSASSFFEDLRTDTAYQRTGTERVNGRDYEYVAFYYLPNGTTDFQTIGGVRYNPKDAYFTLVSREQYGASQPDLPSNFATFTMPPATGRPVVIRP